MYLTWLHPLKGWSLQLSRSASISVLARHPTLTVMNQVPEGRRREKAAPKLVESPGASFPPHVARGYVPDYVRPTRPQSLAALRVDDCTRRRPRVSGCLAYWHLGEIRPTRSLVLPEGSVDREPSRSSPGDNHAHGLDAIRNRHLVGGTSDYGQDAQDRSGSRVARPRH